MTLIQVYATTTTHSEEVIENFYNNLQAVIDSIKTDLWLVMGDFNSKVGDQADMECGLGAFGLGSRNQSGDKLTEFYRANELILTNTSFQHPKRRRYTWISPDSITRNQIDYIAIPKKLEV